MIADPVEVRLRDVCFVHWPVPPEELDPHIPSGETLDTYDGQAWLSVVAMRVRPRFLPGGRGYAQLNVRTYLGGEGRPVYFLDVIVDDLLASGGERVLGGAPARYGHVSVGRTAEGVEVRCVAVDDLLDFDVVPEGDPGQADEGTIEEWLVERYRFRREDGTIETIDHRPWQLQAASGEVGARSLLAELPDPAGEPRFGYSPGLVVEW